VLLVTIALRVSHEKETRVDRGLTSASERPASLPTLQSDIASQSFSTRSVSASQDRILKTTSDRGEGGLSESLGYDQSVVGIPFAVSDSVEVVCKRRRVNLCEMIHEDLTSLSHEARDLAWAPKIESLIRNKVSSQGPDTYSIRSVDCRSTICAVEVESTADAYISTNYNFQVANGLAEGRKAFGEEVDASGHRVMVSLIVFVRFLDKKPSPVSGED
jgi:hypothetical protein